MQNVFEAATFLAEAICNRNFKILNEELVGIDGLAAHLFDFMDGDAAAIEIRIEQAQAMGRVFTSSSGVVRASSRIFSATCAVEIQTFWPLTRVSLA